MPVAFAEAARRDEDSGIGLLEVLSVLAQHWRALALGGLLAAALGYGGSFAITPLFTSRLSFFPPQQQSSSAAAALSQLGALSGLVGAAGGLKAPADQYVALLQSTTVADRLIDTFKLREVYDVDYRFQARKKLAQRMNVSLGRKDGMISVEVEDASAHRAADMANHLVEELRQLSGRLALTEAQQRRVFFEGQLAQTRDRLTQAQQALQASGFSSGALRADARAAAEGYARLRTEVIAAEVRLQMLRRSLAEETPEVQSASSALGALRSQLARLEEPADRAANSDYVGKFREFKYQETLFDMFARQYELARLDESREGVLIQVVDAAAPAELKSWPKRGLLTLASGTCGLLLGAIFLVGRSLWRAELRARGSAGNQPSVRQTSQ
jgi:uncharacterized protein involved in exopolysaccharide biosynthesis